MRIGELAKACGVTRDTLRFYEARGLIQAQRRSNGYRHYPAQTVQLVGFIRTAQQLGFSLSEIGANVAQLWGTDAPDTVIQGLLRDKLKIVDARLAALAQLRQALVLRLTATCPLSPLPDQPHRASPEALETLLDNQVLRP